MELIVDGRNYSIERVSAIAYCNLADRTRQDALLVKYTDDNGEDIVSVVFGFNMPEDEEDFRLMLDEYSAWEFDWEVIESVISYERGRNNDYYNSVDPISDYGIIRTCKNE